MCLGQQSLESYLLDKIDKYSVCLNFATGYSFLDILLYIVLEFEIFIAN